MCNGVWVCEADGKKDKIPSRVITRCDNITPAMKFRVAGYYEHVSAYNGYNHLINCGHAWLYL